MKKVKLPIEEMEFVEGWIQKNKDHRLNKPKTIWQRIINFIKKMI